MTYAGAPKRIHCPACEGRDCTALSHAAAIEQLHEHRGECDGDAELRYQDPNADPRSGWSRPDYAVDPPGEGPRVAPDGGRDLDREPPDGESHDGNGGIRPVPAGVEPPEDPCWPRACPRCEGRGRVIGIAENDVHDCPTCGGSGVAG